MLVQGLVLMIVGVGIVWMFLEILVLVLKLSAMIVPRFNHLLPENEPKTQVPAASTSIHADAATVAIIVAAATSKAQSRDRKPSPSPDGSRTILTRAEP